MTTTGWLGQRYALRELLGHGGVSEVYRARDTRMRRYVAVKCLRSDLVDDTMLRERFRRRIEHTAALDHPAIVAVYEIGATASGDDVFPFLAMEYVDGRPLRRVLSSEGSLRPHRALQITADICAALHFAHRHGAAHGELSPAEVMIDRYGAVKVMNFEVIASHAADDTADPHRNPTRVAADVYAAGCVLYELLVGTPPDGDDPVPPSRHDPAVDTQLDGIVRAALAQDPAERYESPATMRSDVVRALTGEPTAGPVTTRAAAASGPPRQADASPAQPATAPAAAAAAADAAAPAFAAAAATTAGDTERESSPQAPGARAEAPAVAARRRRHRGAPVALLTLLGLLVAAGGIWLGTSGRSTSEPAPIAVPELHGKPSSASTARLRQLELVAKRHPVYCQAGADGTPAPCKANQVGKVLRTAPKPGNKLRKHGTVDVYVAAPAQRVSVPSDLRGETFRAATQRLRKLGLQVAPEPQHSNVNDQSRIGKVVRADPAAGERIAKGTVVTLDVGAKPPSKPTKPPTERTSNPDKPDATDKPEGKRGPNGGGTYVCTKSKLYFAACNRDNLGDVVPYPTYDHH